MNSFITRIAQMFSLESKEIKKDSAEDLDVLTTYFKVSELKPQLPATLDKTGLNERDILTIGLFDGVGKDASEQQVFHTDAMAGWDTFVQYYNGIDKEDPIKIKISIAKRIDNGKVSVYCPDLFAAYLGGQGLKDVLGLFEKNLQEGNLCVEYQEGEISLVGTSLAFVSKGRTPVYLTKPTLNENVTEQAKYICCNDLIEEHLKPTDFEVQGSDNNDNPLLPILQKTVMLYSLCFLFDYVTLVEDKLHYKLNGYKTLTGDIKVGTLSEANVDKESWKQYLEIFKWQYNGGNLTDKSAIARNIVSLNITEDNKLLLRDGTLDAIDSNYLIYEKENVKQYIEIRNNVSNQLRDYQKYIIGIYDEFEGDFKKLFFSFLTFAFTTILIRVLAKNMEDEVLLPDTVICLLLGYCAVSCLYYAYARWKRNMKVELFDKQYNDTRKFYEKLLSQKELKELFTDERNNDGTYKAFIEERTYNLDWVWLGANVVFIIILLYIKYGVNVAV